MAIKVPAKNNTINPAESMRNIPIKIQWGIYDAAQTHKEADTIGTTMTRIYNGDAFVKCARDDLLFLHLSDILLKYSISNSFMK